VFARAVLQTTLRTAFFKQLAVGGDHLHVLGALLCTEGAMSFATSSAVGLRARKDHLRHFDLVWAVGAMTGVAIVFCSCLIIDRWF
jgi:hypothetical protein